MAINNLAIFEKIIVDDTLGSFINQRCSEEKKKRRMNFIEGFNF